MCGLEGLNDINTLILYAFLTTKKRYVFDVVSGTRKEFQTLPFSVCLLKKKNVLFEQPIRLTTYMTTII